MNYQEIIVYVILIIAVIYLLRKNIPLGKKANKDNKGCQGGSGSCGCN